MGGLTQALARGRPATSASIIRCEAEVAPHPRAGRSGRPGVALASGDEYQAPRRGQQRRRQRHLRALARSASSCLPTSLAAVDRISYESASLKINVALAELPNFRACPGASRARSTAAPSTSAPTSTTSSAPTTTPSTAGPRERPVLECTIPSVGGPERRAAGQAPHVDLRAVRALHARARATWDGSARRFADRCFDVLDEYAPNFNRSVLARQVRDAAGPGAHLRSDRRQHLPGGDDRSTSSSPFGRCRAARAIARRSRGCTCAARPLTRAAAYGHARLERRPRDLARPTFSLRLTTG